MLDNLTTDEKMQIKTYFSSIKLPSTEKKIIPIIGESLKKQPVINHWCSCKVELSSWYFLVNIKTLKSGIPVTQPSLLVDFSQMTN